MTNSSSRTLPWLLVKNDHDKRYFMFFPVICSTLFMQVIHPSKKVTQHDFDQLYQSVYGFIFIMLGIIWKLDYLSFHWYCICHDCFAGTCARRLNWVQCQKINVAKLDHNFNRWYQFVYEIIFVLGIIWKPIYFSLNWYVDLLWFSVRNVRKVIKLDAMSKNKCSRIALLFEIQHDVLFRRISVQWMGPCAVGTRAYAHKRNGTKHDITRISHRIRSILQLFLFDIAPNVIILHTPQWNNPNK